MCCSLAGESCLLCTCSRCRNKQTGLPAEKGTIQVEWQQWKWIEEQTDDGVHFNTKLVRHSGTLSELLILSQDKLKNETTTHVQLVKNQTKEYRDMITNSNDTTVIAHVDFSEAWKCKYASEIQACHYGQNLPQITLHIGMYHTKYEKAGFCNVLQSKHQDAAAIWTHMDQTLKDIRTTFPTVETIHFWSDGPSKQYKNRTFSSFVLFLPGWVSKMQRGNSFQHPMAKVPLMALGQW